MNIPEEFGKYLLLKKLTEDPLGETFRAGKVGQGGMEQVVLLRVFNGKGVDGEKLWAKVSARGGVHDILKSPNIGKGVDLGRVRSFPYTAYDYISGKNLATVFAQAARQFSPIPTDHALLIAERISLALAAAYESRLQDERVLHGFVTPHLVMVSNEGETRLLGFEVAPGLRELAAAGWHDESVRPYLSPETLSGAPVAKTDDIWSLGAILYELLTGERLPVAPADGYGAIIDAAQLPNEGTALPAPVAALLKKSLAPREQRIADAATWHKTLSKLMIEGHFSPTTFNLAFFMHNLFREEIERESQEMQAEKKLDLPQRPAAPAAVPAATAPVPAADVREATGVRQGTLAGARVAQAARKEPSKAPLWIGLAAAALIAAGAAGYFLFFRPGAGKEAPAQVASGPAPTGPAATAPASMPGTQPPGAQLPTDPNAPPSPSPEELQAQIQKMFESRSEEMESKFKEQYDAQIKQLQKQLEDSKRAAAEQERLRQERPSAPAQEPAPAPAETRTVQRPEPTAQQPQVTPPQPSPSVPQQQAPAVSDPVEEKPAPAPAQTEPVKPAPQPVKPQVRVGDLVQPGPGVAAPKLISKLEPRYPPAAKRLNRAAQVDIKVLVDERGKVLDAERIGAKAGFGFDEAALDAAQRAQFQPATKEGVKVKMWTTLRVSFKAQS